VSRAGSEKIEELNRRVRSGVSKLGGLEIGDQLAVEVLSRLVEGRRTSSEIVTLIYGLKRGDEGFESSYGRVRREIRKLESKGLISRNLFGREKPYRLTQLAVTNLARIGGEEKQTPLMMTTDLAAYLVTLALSVPNALQAVGWLQLSDVWTLAVITSFCFFLGFSSSRVLVTLRRVF